MTEDTRAQVAARLNFAQAALVLQNSSGIYSRKVDYLHSHVHQVQQELSLNELGVTANNSKRSKSKAGIDADVEEFLNFDPHQEFLLLDDVLPTDLTEECHKINLADAASNDPNQSVQTTGTRLSMGSTALNRRLSLGSVGTTLDQTTRSASNGNNLAAQRAFLGAAAAQDMAGGSLRLTGNHCDIGEEGVLFLPGSQSSSQPTEEPPNPNNAMDTDDNDDDFGGGGGGGGAFDDGMDDNNDDGGVAFAMADDDDNNDPAAAAAQQKKRVTFADSAAPLPQQKQKPAAVVDPWAMLDRDTPDSKRSRPLRVGKTIALPDSVDALPSECVTGTRTRRTARNKRRDRRAAVPRAEGGAAYSLAAATFRATLLGKRPLDESGIDATAVPLKGLAYGNEFAYIAKATAKRKADEHRALRKQQQQAPVAMGGENDDDGGFGFGGADYEDEDNDYGGGGDVFGDDNHGPLHHNSNTGIASVDDVYNQNNYIGACAV